MGGHEKVLQADMSECYDRGAVSCALQLTEGNTNQ